MMTNSLLSRFCCARISHLAIAMLVVPAWSSVAFCGEIHTAAQRGDLAMVKALLKADPGLVASTDTNGWTPLHTAAMAGQTNVAAFLLDNQADVNARDKINDTPLHLAAVMSQRTIARRTTQAGTSSPPHVGSRPGQTEMVKLLLDHKAEVDAKTQTGQTPLHSAAKNGHKDVVELLLANQADVNTKDTGFGNTPLHRAALDGHVDVAEVLLANKTDVNAKNKQGETPLQVALAHGHNDVAEALRQHGGHE
jgi:ankyrin repeat protein